MCTMVQTLGSEKLRSFLASFGQSKLAEKLGITQQAVSYWSTGHRRPQPHVRVVLCQITGIPEHDWLTETEQTEIEQITSKA